MDLFAHNHLQSVKLKARPWRQEYTRKEDYICSLSLILSSLGASAALRNLKCPMCTWRIQCTGIFALKIVPTDYTYLTARAAVENDTEIQEPSSQTSGAGMPQDGQSNPWKCARPPQYQAATITAAWSLSRACTSGAQNHEVLGYEPKPARHTQCHSELGETHVPSYFGTWIGSSCPCET